MDGTELHVQASIWHHCIVIERRDHQRMDRLVLGCSPDQARPLKPRPENDGPLHIDRWSRRLPGMRSDRSHRMDLAVLIMEGEAPEKLGSTVARDALHRAVLARGLRLATDLDHLDVRPVPGWRLLTDDVGAVTLEWPHVKPLLCSVPLDLPAGWLRIAMDEKFVIVLVGHGLGLHEHAVSRDQFIPDLQKAAGEGALAAGAVTVTNRPGPIPASG